MIAPHLVCVLKDGDDVEGAVEVVARLKPAPREACDPARDRREPPEAALRRFVGDWAVREERGRDALQRALARESGSSFTYLLRFLISLSARLPPPTQHITLADGVVHHTVRIAGISVHEPYRHNHRFTRTIAGVRTEHFTWWEASDGYWKFCSTIHNIRPFRFNARVRRFVDRDDALHVRYEYALQGESQTYNYDRIYARRR